MHSYIEDIVFEMIQSYVLEGTMELYMYVHRYDNLNCGPLNNPNLSFKQFKTLQLLSCVGYTVSSLPYYISVKDNKLACRT